MATADRDDVKNRLPHQIKEIPNNDQIDVALEEATAKTANYDITDSSGVKRAEANWACYYLLKSVIQVPQTETDGPITNELAEDPAAEFKRNFYNIVTTPGLELI